MHTTSHRRLAPLRLGLTGARIAGLLAAVIMLALSTLPASALTTSLAEEGWIINDGASVIVPVTATCDASGTLYATVQVRQPSGRLIAEGAASSSTPCSAGELTTVPVTVTTRYSPFKSGAASVFVHVTEAPYNGWGTSEELSGSIRLQK